MPVVPVILVAVSVATEVAATAEQKKASDAAANTAKQTADYNNKLDLSEAAQTDIDARANIAAMRQDAAVYMSRQASSFARNGVIATTGSALAVQAATKGKFEMREQTVYNNAQAKEQMLASQGQAGIAVGAAQADQYHMEGVADVLSGASKVAGTLYSGYMGGAFGSAGSSTSTALDSMGGGTTTTSGAGPDSAGEI